MNFNQSNTFPSIVAGDAYVDRLFINGIRFRDVVASLIAEDVLEQQELEDLRNILLYLDTTGLNQPWVVDNNNRNATLKTLITAIETKLNFIDTTALSQSSVLNNDNRNSVLKTAIDGILTKLTNINTTGLTVESVLTDDNRNSVLKTRIDSNDGSVTDLTNKTRYILTSSVGNNSANPKTANTLLVSTNNNPANIHKGDIQLLVGLGQIRIKHDTQTIGDNNYTDNQINIQNPGGMINSDARLNRMMASDKIEIGQLGIQSSAAINIGGKGAQINIGSIDTPAIGETNTIITIGKRTATRNTETNLQGNFFTTEARWEDLTVTTGLTLASIYSLLSGSAPSYVLGAFVSVAGGFNYSDILHMNLSNPIQKNKDIATSKGITIDSLKIFDTSPISIFPKISTYFVNGDIVSTQVVGQNTTSVLSGQIKIENHNNLNPLDINWALSQNDELVNVIDIKGNDGIFIHQGASSNGKPFQIMNSCNGAIQLLVGGTNNPDNRGRKSEAVGGLFLKRVNQLSCSITKDNPDASLFSFKRKTNNPTAQNDYRLLVSVDDDIPQGLQSPDGIQKNHGIVVYNEAKHKAIDDAAIANATQPIYLEYSTIDEDNITTPSLTFLGNYGGTTTATLYKNGNGDLMWDGQPVAVGSIAASGGGLTYVISAPSNTSITHANQVPTSLTMSSTYTSAPLRTATLSAYNNNTNYQIVSILGAIPKSANPILSGTYELNQFVDFASNVSGSLYAKLYFTGLPLNNVLINKTYTGPVGSGNTLNLTSPQILVPVNDVSITISSITFPSVSIGGPDFTFTTLTVTLVDQSSTVLYTFPAVSGSTNTTFDRVFSPASPVTITDTTNITSLRFNLQSSNSNCVLNQTVAASATNARYILEGSSIRMLLYDGTTNPTTLSPNANALYALSLPLPVTPFVITDYQNPNVTLEEWFIQPSGTTSNHTVALRFNDTALSHLHTSIASISATPTLSTVMTAGNSVGNTDLNMNGQDITNVDTITANTMTPTAITGWNVKSLTEGSGISIINNNGNHTIHNVGITPTISQVLQQGNNANTQSLSGINVLTATTVNATNIPNWNVKQITGGTDIVVSSDQNGNYVISYDAAGSAYEASPDDYTITSATAYGRKPTFYGSFFSRDPIMTSTNTCADIYISSNGKIIAFAHKDTGDASSRTILYSNNYGLFFNNGNISKNWISIAGTTTGDAIWALQGLQAPNFSNWPREIWRSNDGGATWTQQPSPPDFQNGNPRRIRVSGDGKFQLISDPRSGSLGKIYKSSDYGATWTSQNITFAQSTAFGVAMSATGQVQYVEVSATSEGLHANNNNGGIYRSTNYGATWAYVYTVSIDSIAFVSCDATGRIVAATTGFEVITSRDYGLTWRKITLNGATAVSVSPNGNIIWVGCTNQPTATQLYYSDDYGMSFVVGNQSPAGSYVSTNWTSIATNNDGTIVMGGGQANFNGFRLSPSQITDLSQGTGITITGNQQGFYTIGLTKSLAYTYFTDISLAPNTNLTFPTNMDLFRYDYEMDITLWDVAGIGSGPWFFLRFNNDVGLTAWTANLFFNPEGTIGGTTFGLYNNVAHGANSIYWLNAGNVSANRLTVKATYRISAISAQSFVVYLMSSQPVNMAQANSVNARYMVYATKIYYTYSTNDVSRWCPSSFAIRCNNSNDFITGRCLMKQVIKSSNNLSHN